MDWLDLLAVQGTLKSLLQHHSSKASILWRSAFFIVQLSQPYRTTGKTIALTRWTFVGKVISLLFNMLSRLVIREGNGTPLQYSCLENPMDGGVWQAAVLGVAKSPQSRLSDFTFTFMRWRRKWQTTPVFLPGESQGRRSLVGCLLWGRTESDTTEVTQPQQQQQQVGHNFSSKELASFNFMAAVTTCSDFGAPKNKVCHCLLDSSAAVFLLDQSNTKSQVIKEICLYISH